MGEKLVSFLHMDSDESVALAQINYEYHRWEGAV